MAERYNFERNEVHTSPDNIIIQDQIDEYLRKNPDYGIHKLELVSSEMDGCFDEITFVFKRKNDNGRQEK